MTAACRICGSTDLATREMPQGHPHYAALWCRACGRFVTWLPKPQTPIPDYCLEAAVPRVQCAELVGTPNQIRWAKQIRAAMLVVLERERMPRLAMLVRSIRDSTWFIANVENDACSLHWPSRSQLDPASLAREEAAPCPRSRWKR